MPTAIIGTGNIGGTLARHLVRGGEPVVFAVWLDTIKELTVKDANLLENKVVVDPSNPIGIDENGEVTRTLRDDQSAGSLVAAMLPTDAHYVKAFGHARRREPRASAGSAVLRHR